MAHATASECIVRQVALAEIEIDAASVLLDAYRAAPAGLFAIIAREWVAAEMAVCVIARRQRLESLADAF